MLNVDFRSPTTPSMQVDSAAGGPPCAMGRPAQPTNAHAGEAGPRHDPTYMYICPMPVYVVCVRLPRTGVHGVLNSMTRTVPVDFVQGFRPVCTGSPQCF
jgi:hypothetical protein